MSVISEGEQNAMKSFGLQDLGQYQASGLQNVVEEASPHQLIQMLLDGGLDRIATARAQIAQGDIAGKGLSIGRAIAIVDGLRVSLDHSHSRQLSENLESLYEYMMDRLSNANLTNDVGTLEEVESLLGRIRDAWTQVAPVQTTSAA